MLHWSDDSSLSRLQSGENVASSLISNKKKEKVKAEAILVLINPGDPLHGAREGGGIIPPSGTKDEPIGCCLLFICS